VSNPNTALLALMLVSIWVHVGGQMLVFLAGLDAIPQAYFDAALVDGAGRGAASARHDAVAPTGDLVVVLTGVISALQMFTLVFVLTQGSHRRCPRPTWWSIASTGPHLDRRRLAWRARWR